MSEPERQQAGNGGKFSCVELAVPTADELTRLGDRFELHELAIEDALKAHQRPKLERYGDSHFLVLKTARYDDEAEAVELGEIQFLFGDDFVVIVRHDTDSALPLDTALEPDDTTKPPGVIVHRVTDQVVDAYQDVIDGFEVDLHQVEETVFAEEIYPTKRIYLLKRQLLSFLHSTRPLIEPMAELSRTAHPGIPAEMAEYFRDIEDHLRRVVTRTERASSLLSEMLDANLAQVGIRQNEDMRRISAWAAVFLLPTVLSGIWGMNFANMPETEWVYAYPVALAVMLLGTVLLYRKLRKSGWL